jgi:Calcineurin-like phosphoesterase
MLLLANRLGARQNDALAQANSIELRAFAISVQEVDLAWSLPPAVSGITVYLVSRDGQALATTDAATLTYVDTGVQPARQYTYSVEGLDAAGQSVLKSRTARVKTPRRPDTLDNLSPTAPEDLSITSIAGGNLLDWHDSIDDTDVTVYLISRDGKKLGTVDSSTRSYLDASAQTGISYIYTVEAIDVNGQRSKPSGGQGRRRAEAQLPLAALFDARSALAAPAAAPAAAYAAQLTRYPYLTDAVGPYATINWATDRSATSGSARWGQVAGDGSCTPTNTVVASRSNLVVNSINQYQWKAPLTLTAGTQYCYRVYLGSTDLLASDASPRFWTQVPAGSSQPFSFVVFGDWGSVDSNSQNPQQANLMTQIAQSGARFGLTIGDNAYPSGSQNNYGDLRQTGASLSGIFGPAFWKTPGASIPLFPALGNHGLARSDTLHPHLLNWPQDQAVASSGGRYAKECCIGTSTSYASAWYAFDAGNARFYVLQAAWSDSCTPSDYECDYNQHWTPGSAEYQWLANDLAAHPTGLKFAIFHYPLYSDKSDHASDTFLQGPNGLEGLLSRSGVNIAFTGHSHLIQRNAKPNANSLISYVVGAGGAKLEPIGPDGCLPVDLWGRGWSYSANGGAGGGSACGAANPASSLDQVFSFLLVTINGTQVTVAPINSLGQTFDVQTYTFDTVAPTSTPIPTAAPTDPPLPTNTPTDIPLPTNTPTNTPLPTNTPTPLQLSFTPSADAQVQNNKLTTNYGTLTTLELRNSNQKYNSYLKFAVTGLVGSIQSAKLRLYVANASNVGGSIYAVANNYNNTSTPWVETGLNWSNAPALSGPPLHTVGAVAIGTWVEFDVTAAIPGNGTYSFGLSTTVNDNVVYNSKEATTNRPALVIQLAAPTPTSTPIPTATPTDPPIPTATPTDPPLPTNTPTAIPVATNTPTDPPLPTNTPTAIPVATNTPTDPPLPTNTPTDTPLATATPASAPPIFSDGFESGTLAAWTTGNLTVQSSTVHNGSFAAQGNTTVGNTYAKKTLPSSYTTGYGRVYFNLLSYASQVNLLRLRTAADASIAYLYVDTAGRLNLRNDAGAATFTSTTVVGSGWHSLEFRAAINGTAGTTEVWLDGSPINAFSLTTNLGTTAIGRFQIGEVQAGRTYNVVFDDAVFNTQPIGP